MAAGQHPAPVAALYSTTGRNGAYEDIESYAAIGNQRTAALVARDGSIDWGCFPRFDSPSMFGRLLDAHRGGHWQVRPAVPFHTSRCYLPHTNVLETTFDSAEGSFTLTDFMPHLGTRHAVGPVGEIVRIVRGTRGTTPVAIEFNPRLDYGRSDAAVTRRTERAWEVVSEPHAATLTSSVPLVEDEPHGWRTTVREGETFVLILTFSFQDDVLAPDDAVAYALEQERLTIDAWRSWASRCAYEGPYRDEVVRSALALQLLNYAPTGATVAAITTSLPERIGGERNWDYRYTWLRDTAYAHYALTSLGYPEEGERFLEWIKTVCGGDPAALSVLYSVDGSREAPEHTLDHLEGYRGSRPVRLGNAAHRQLQLDVYGEVLDSAYTVYAHTGRLNPDLWPFLRATVEFVCEHWRDPDQGIWEVRAEPRHFVYSKALCWVAIDRGVKLANAWGLDADLARWQHTREEIAGWIMTAGRDPETGVFTQAAGHPGLDASLLALPLRKVVAANSPAMTATIESIVASMRTDGLLHRVSREFVDGISGGEGAFLLCSFWLADCYVYMGRIEEARELFDHLLGCANDVGLFSEEYDPVGRHQLGNFPQAFTHMALISSAVNLARAEGVWPPSVEAAGG